MRFQNKSCEQRLRSFLCLLKIWLLLKNSFGLHRVIHIHSKAGNTHGVFVTIVFLADRFLPTKQHWRVYVSFLVLQNCRSFILQNCRSFIWALSAALQPITAMHC